MSASAPLLITDSTAIARAIVAVQALGGAHLVPVLRAVAAGRIAVFTVNPGGRVSEAEIRNTGRPTLMLLGDDPPNGMARGPAGFPQVRKLLRAAGSIIVHGAGAEIVHYEMAVAAAELLGVAVLIECSASMAPTWAALARRYAPVLLIQPRDGRHPVGPRELGVVLQ